MMAWRLCFSAAVNTLWQVKIIESLIAATILFGIVLKLLLQLKLVKNQRLIEILLWLPESCQNWPHSFWLINVIYGQFSEKTFD